MHSVINYNYKMPTFVPIAYFFLSLTGYCIFLRDRMKLPLEITPLFTATLIINLEYIASLIGILTEVSFILLHLGSILLFLSILFPKKSRGGLVKDFFSPGMIIFGISILLFFIHTRNASYTGWDTYSHWGLATKLIFQENSLPNADSVLVSKDYPPALQMLQYYFIKNIGFTEGNVIFAQCFLICAAIAAFFQKIKWRVAWIAGAVFFIVYSAIYNLGYTIPIIEADLPLAIMIGSVVVCYFMIEDRIARIWFIASGIMAISLIKTTGGPLGILLIGLVVCDQGISYFLERKKNPKPSIIRQSQTERTLQIISILVLLVGFSFFQISWKNYVTNLHAASIHPIQLSLDKLTKSLSPATQTEIERQTISSFLYQFSRPQGRTDSYFIFRFLLVFHSESEIYKFRMPSILLIIGLILVLAAIAILFQPNREKRFESLASNLILAAGFVVYLFGLLTNYLYTFSEYEAVRSASFARYVNTYLLAWLLIVIGFLVRKAISAEKWSGFSKIILVSLAITGIVMLPRASIYQLLKPLPELSEERSYLRQIAVRLDQEIPKESKVYFVWQDSTGLPYYEFGYEIAPRRENPFCWSLGEKYYSGDVWTCNQTLDDLVKGYDYLILARIDDPFIQTYGSNFDSTIDLSKTILFKIQYEEDGKLQLIPVQETPPSVPVHN